MAAFGTSKSSRVGTSELRIPTGIRRVLRHVPVEIRRAVVPPRRTALAERRLIIAGIDNAWTGDGQRPKARSLPRHLRGDTVSSPGIALIDDLQSWRVLSVLEPV
jgi:hypothetical protein